MADSKLTDLTADTTRSLADLVYTVTDVSTTPASRKMTVQNFLRESATELTISGGAVTFTQLNHKLQPESSTSDDLDTINGTTDGQSGTIHVSDFGTDTITIKHNTGNILCVGDADIALSNGCVFWYSNGTKVFISGGGGGGSLTQIRSGVVANPNSWYTNIRPQIFMFRTDAAITITRIHISGADNSPTSELAGDLKFADDTFTGSFANATVIDVCDTTNGVFTATSGFDDATVPSGKYVYFQLDSAPHADWKDFFIEVHFTYD